MRERPVKRLRPGLERLEGKALMSAGALTKPVAAAGAVTANLVVRGVDAQTTPSAGFTIYRITNPDPFNAQLIPPFRQVLVQTTVPTPGVVYNVLSVSVRNGTARTFDASSGFAARVTGQSTSVPILSGTDQWKPGQVMVFYILTKKYYPLRPITGAGFEFDFNGSRCVSIPGPSGIFLRLRYRPATFAKTLDWIVAHGPGSKGHLLGLPDTSIWEFTSAKTNIPPL